MEKHAKLSPKEDDNAVKKLPALLIVTISKHQGEFYCLNYLHSFTTEKKLELYKKVCENKDFVL